MPTRSWQDRAWGAWKARFRDCLADPWSVLVFLLILLGLVGTLGSPALLLPRTPHAAAQQTLSISGATWFDRDGNGQREADEPLLRE